MHGQSVGWTLFLIGHTTVVLTQSHPSYRAILWGWSVKFNMHNISNMSIAFIEQTMPTYMHNIATCVHNMPTYMHNIATCVHNMPTCMHNMPMFMYNMPSCKHNMSSCMHMSCINVQLQYANMHVQHIILQTQHANMHAQNANMSYAHTTCPIYHAVMQSQYARVKCMRSTATWHSPKIKVHGWAHKGISLHHTLGKDFEVAEKPSLLGNKYKGHIGEPLPTCQGPWGTLHQISRLYTQDWQFPRATDMTGATASTVALMVLQGWTQQAGTTVPAVFLP